MPRRIKIYNLNIEYSVDYRNIKYPRLEFKTGKLILVLPKGYNDEIKLIEKYKEWIYKKSLIINTAKKKSKKKKIVTRNDVEYKRLIVNLVNIFSKEINVKVNKIYFRKLISKWGSCSPKKNLTFNILLKYLPISLIKYVVYHELAHIKEEKHSERFWNIIEKKFKNYKKKEEELLIYWFLIQESIYYNSLS